MSGFRLSPHQRRIFQLDRTAATANRVQAVVRLVGAADAERIVEALRELVASYEILRTAFPEVAALELPVQEPRDPWLVEMRRHDLGDLEAQEQAERAAALGRQALEREIVSTGADLLQLDWIAIGPEAALLVWTQPALWGDAESVLNLWAEAVERVSESGGYEQEPMQYADVAEWLNEILEGEDAEEGLAHWRKKQARLPSPVFPLASDADSAPYRARTTAVPIRPDRIDALSEDFTSEDEADAFLAAIWAAILARYCDTDSMALGIYTDGRSYEGLEEVVGLFAKYLPIAVESTDRSSPGEIASRLRDEIATAGEWQEYYGWEGIDSGADDVPFGFESRSLPSGRIEGSRWQVERLDSLLEPHLLRLCVRRTGSDLALELVSDTERLSETAARQVAGAFAAALSAALDRRDLPVDDLPLVPPDAEASLATGFGSGSPTEAPPAGTVLDLIEEQIAADGDTIAVSDPGGALDYSELWGRAGQIAQRITAEGLGAGDVVAVCCRRSTDMLCAILGVLRAGAAYLPLDPGYPAERLAFMVADSGAGLVLAHAATAEQTAALELPRVDLESIRGEAGEAGEAGDPQPSKGDLAYIIYTSGSTGRPKGVAVSHDNLLHSTFARRLRYPEPPERFLLLSSYAFDSSIVGLFWTLTSGATLVLPAEGTEQDTAALAELVAAERITHTLCLPTLYALLLDQADAERLTSLRQVIVAGEVCPPALVHRHAEVRSDAALVNEYGPTEATVWASSARFESEDVGTMAPGATVPIGAAIPFARVDLVDRRGRIVPPGVPGEIAVGGAGVARGYIGQPRLTAERFRPDPYSDRPGARVYRTGDRGRRRADGTLEFLGRLDHQVKVRGVRIEPEEIEACLLTHDAVAQAIVEPHGGGSDGDDTAQVELVAYLVSEDEAPSVSEVRQHLQRTLPESMIPAHFVFLEALPLAPNGKVDRSALPEPSEGRPDLAADYVEPEGTLETYLVEQWQAVLQADEIGVLDNFFELGGNSIQAAIFMNRLRGEIDEFVHVGRLFEHPTVRGLAEVLRHDHAEAVSRLGDDGAPRAQTPRDQAEERPAGRSTPDARALETIDDLSDEEVDSMLDELFSQEEAGS